MRRMERLGWEDVTVSGHFFSGTLLFQLGEVDPILPVA
jgi:hypothetical protein